MRLMGANATLQGDMSDHLGQGEDGLMLDGIIVKYKKKLQDMALFLLKTWHTCRQIGLLSLLYSFFLIAFQSRLGAQMKVAAYRGGACGLPPSQRILTSFSYLSCSASMLLNCQRQEGL